MYMKNKKDDIYLCKLNFVIEMKPNNDVLYHMIKELFNKNEWKKFNDLNFKYAKCSTCTENLGLNRQEKTKGFFTEYSRSTASEDMAEVYSHIIYLNAEKIKKIRNLDRILNKKISYIENKIKKIDNSFIF